MKSLDKERLCELYLDQDLTPYQIGKILNCDHKTVRRYLKIHKIPLRTASEYNFLARKNYSSPRVDSLWTAKSAAAHIAYLCEGWHTEKTNQVYFCNTDPQLVQLIVWLLQEVYHVKRIRYVLVTSGDTSLLTEFPNAKVYIDPLRKTPIIRIFSGGKMLARDLIQNAYSLLRDMS